ncbi:MAG: PilZ domain-containing protein [Terriglobia bacterium]
MEKPRRGKERRRSERLPLAVPVFARGVDEAGKEFLEFTTTLNISAGGALLAMRRYLATESPVTLEIPAAPLPKLAGRPKLVRSVEARIIRVVPSEPSYLWALSFSSPLL